MFYTDAQSEFSCWEKNYFSLVTCAPKVNCTFSLESILNDTILVNLKVSKDGEALKGLIKSHSCAHVTGHQCNLAGFDGIKPIVTTDCTGPFARLDLKTGRSGYFFYETQGNCKVGKSMRVLHNKIEKKKIMMTMITKVIMKLKCKNKRKRNNESWKKANKQTKANTPT